jgi:hypothetical protein
LYLEQSNCFQPHGLMSSGRISTRIMRQKQERIQASTVATTMMHFLPLLIRLTGCFKLGRTLRSQPSSGETFSSRFSQVELGELPTLPTLTIDHRLVMTLRICSTTTNNGKLLELDSIHRPQLRFSPSMRQLSGLMELPTFLLIAISAIGSVHSMKMKSKHLKEGESLSLESAS